MFAITDPNGVMDTYPFASADHVGLTATYPFGLPNPLGSSPTKVGELPNPFGITATYPSGPPRGFGSSPTVVFVDLKPLGRPPTIVGTHPKSCFLFGDRQLCQTGHFYASDTYVKCSLLFVGLPTPHSFVRRTLRTRGDRRSAACAGSGVPDP